MNATHLSVQLPGGLETSVRQAVPDVVTAGVTVLLIGLIIFSLTKSRQLQLLALVATVVNVDGFETKHVTG